MKRIDVASDVFAALLLPDGQTDRQIVKLS
jgi:hypothetical protein